MRHTLKGADLRVLHEGGMAHIFISYAKKDTRLLAAALFQALNKLDGISAWMDNSLEADSSWAAQIQHEIDRADYVIVLLSPDVNRKETPTQPRSFVLNEIDYAQQDKKPILPVMVTQTRMPVQIAGIQFIDLTDEPSDPTKIIQRVKRRFGIEGMSEDEPPTPPSGIPMNLRQETIGIIVLILIAIVGGFLLLNGRNGGQNPNPTPTEHIAASPTETPRLSNFEQLQTAESFDKTATAQTLLDMQARETASAVAMTETYALGQILQRTATFTPTATDSATLTPTIATATFTHTHTATATITPRP